VPFTAIVTISDPTPSSPCSTICAKTCRPSVRRSLIFEPPRGLRRAFDFFSQGVTVGRPRRSQQACLDSSLPNSKSYGQTALAQLRLIWRSQCLSERASFRDRYGGQRALRANTNGRGLKQEFSGDELADIRAVYEDYCAKTGWNLQSPPASFYPTYDRGPGYTTRCYGVIFEDGTTGNSRWKRRCGDCSAAFKEKRFSACVAAANQLRALGPRYPGGLSSPVR